MFPRVAFSGTFFGYSTKYLEGVKGKILAQEIYVFSGFPIVIVMSLQFHLSINGFQLFFLGKTISNLHRLLVEVRGRKFKKTPARN